MKEDPIARILRESDTPQSDATAIEITSRLFRLCTHVERRLSTVYAAYDAIHLWSE